MEVWKDIKGYDGRYQISNFGNVKSVGRYVNSIQGKRWIKEKILKQSLNMFGYPYVTIRNLEGKNYKARIHREVSKAFIPNPENKKTVNHIDGNKKNNHISNLEWSTYQENMQHAYDTGLKNGNHRKVKIDMFTKDMVYVKTFDSIQDAIDEYGCNRGNLQRNLKCHPRRKTVKNHIWRYHKEKDT